ALARWRGPRDRRAQQADQEPPIRDLDALAQRTDPSPAAARAGGCARVAVSRQRTSLDHGHLGCDEKNRNYGRGSTTPLGALVNSAADARRWLRTPRVSGVLLSAAFLLLALHGLGDVAIVHSDESREVGIVQDVVAGHWLLPRFNDEMLPDKPILSHWLAAIPCALVGFSEEAVRFTSALAA